MYLDILHVFYTYPKRVQDTFWDTHQIPSRYMYLARFLGVTLDTYQDTPGYVYLGLFITIHVYVTRALYLQPRLDTP